MKTDVHNSLILVSGGARSGKSTFAEALATAMADRRSDPGPVAYIATGQAMDSEFTRRIKAHQQRRSQRFVTCEEPLELESALRRALAAGDIALVECIPTWLGNLYFHLDDEKIPPRLEALMAYFSRLRNIPTSNPADMAQITVNQIVTGKQPPLADVARDTRTARKIVIVVTNETGLGIVPAEAASRLYRDELGWLNQQLAVLASAFFFCVAGMARQIK